MKNLDLAPLASNDQCKQPGYSCVSSCSELILCVDLGSSVYHAASIATCNTSLNQFCDADKQDCSGQYCNDEGAKNEPFTCQAKGSFPHPFDCTQYYTCNEEGKVVTATKCSTNKSYNAANGKCDLDMTSRACKASPVDKCKKPGQTGVINENHVLFYICEINSNNYLVPNLYACTSAFEYNPSTKTCAKVEKDTGGAGVMVVFNGFLLLASMILSLYH